ncbi:MAG: aminotransferase class I/II-fold pyridoxal phosphate-dependent enzyme [Deltaproteobacteria bacterium]|nr:MAG: aminotransferase class I/II-fold pyridoxal phosphate-dependent enzyme [Deltaproteobacteria bacterium]
MEFSEYLATVEAMHLDGQKRGLFFQVCDDSQLEGRTIALDGKPLVSFSSCSYLGLELHPKLIEGAQVAAARYGTQFSSSRGYISAAPYLELEEKLSEIMGGHALVTSTTTLGHQSTLMTLATEHDAIVLDHQVHHSVHLAANLARANGATVKIVRHGQLDRGYDLLKELSRTHENVWFACDGVFSMFGDLAPFGILEDFLAIAPNIRLYVDDAHGMSWTGKYGRGCFLSHMPLQDRIVVAVSLCKAFGAGGACVVFAREEERERVRMCGGPQLFSGPMQPPMLGASLASARIHLTDELVTLQDQLRERILYVNQAIEENGLPLLVRNEAPIIFVPMGAPKVACTVAERMRQDGHFINVSMYPAVPLKRSGIRIALTSLHTMEEIDGMLSSLVRHAYDVMEEESLSPATIDEVFRNAVPSESKSGQSYRSSHELVAFAGIDLHKEESEASHSSSSSGKEADHELAAPTAKSAVELTVSHHTTIYDVGPKMWDRTLGTEGSCSWNAMVAWEKIFKNHPDPAHRWEFHYIVVKNHKGKPVAVTFFTQTLLKDDMLMRETVSQAVEEQRADDPLFLTSKCMMMGCLASEGNHLYLDKSGPWQEALHKILETITLEVESSGASALMLRDLPGEDPTMDQFFLENGFVKIPMLDSHRLELTWPNEDVWLESLRRKQRYYVMRQMRDVAEKYEHQIFGCNAGQNVRLTEEEHDQLYALYRAVDQQKKRINIFPFPSTILRELEQNPAWEIVTFKLPEEHGGPGDSSFVAFYAAHICQQHYMPLFCGLDYRFVREHGAYRQMLYHMKRRAEELHMRVVHYGMDADFVKSRLGTQAHQWCAYVQSRDDYNATVLGQIVAELGVSKR